MGMYCTVTAVRPGAEGRMRIGAGGVGAAMSGDSYVSLEKAWHGLHYLLTGSATEGTWPLGFLLEGGEPVGVDDGYGCPRLFDADAVRDLDGALAAVSDDDLWSRFDPGAMEAEGVYPGVWDEPEDDLRDEYTTYFRELKALVGRARADGMGLMVSIG